MGILLPGRVDQISGFGGFTWVDQGPVHVWSWLAGGTREKFKVWVWLFIYIDMDLRLDVAISDKSVM